MVLLILHLGINGGTNAGQGQLGLVLLITAFNNLQGKGWSISFNP